MYVLPLPILDDNRKFSIILYVSIVVVPTHQQRVLPKP